MRPAPCGRPVQPALRTQAHLRHSRHSGLHGPGAGATAGKQIPRSMQVNRHLCPQQYVDSASPRRRTLAGRHHGRRNVPHPYRLHRRRRRRVRAQGRLKAPGVDDFGMVSCTITRSSWIWPLAARRHGHGGDEGRRSSCHCLQFRKRGQNRFSCIAVTASIPPSRRNGPAAAIARSGTVEVLIGQITEVRHGDGRLEAVQWMDGEGENTCSLSNSCWFIWGISPKLWAVDGLGSGAGAQTAGRNPATLATSPGDLCHWRHRQLQRQETADPLRFHEATMAAFAAAEYRRQQAFAGVHDDQRACMPPSGRVPTEGRQCSLSRTLWSPQL